MILKVVPVGASLVPLKHSPPKQAARYIGRVYDAKIGGWPASKDPESINSDTARSTLVIKLAKRVQSGDLMPADEATAKALNVPFSPVEWQDGVWVKAQPKTQPRSSKAAHGGTD